MKKITLSLILVSAILLSSEHDSCCNDEHEHLGAAELLTFEVFKNDIIDNSNQIVFAKKDEAKAAAEAKAKEEQAKQLAEHTVGFTQTESGLYYMMIQEGKGDATPNKGQKVSVHYKGMLLDGKVFDSSYNRNQPLDFNVGVGQVIPGWDEGIMLLKVGDKARFVIPSDLAYGAAGAGGVIPPNAALIFDVELMAIK